MPLALTPHPRLYVSASQIAALASRPGKAPTTSVLARAARSVAQRAEAYCASAEFPYDLNTHNAHLIRARIAQTRVVTLLVRHFQTGEQRYFDAAFRHVEAIAAWEYWSWITWRQSNPDPLAIFDLSYGENSTTLAIAYDWMHAGLDSRRRDWLVGVARERSFKPFLARTPGPDGEKGMWWYGAKQSNWNTVCAGGAGMLALAMLDVAPEAAEVLARAERSVKPYFEELAATNGAWPEGIGYWNYGMRYGFMYLLSHERATGAPHPLLRQEATRKTLWFPPDFAPNGVPCSFGDVNSWSVLPFHLAAAEALGETALTASLLSRMDPDVDAVGSWPTAAETLVLHPARVSKPPRPAKSVVRTYAGLDWSLIADRLPDPNLFLAIRGGTTEVPHGHRDLTSYHCVVRDEALISSLGVREYLDTTFSPRRWELFETTPPSKNVVLIGGVGIAGPSTVKTSTVDLGKGLHGIHLDATQAMGGMRDGPVAELYARLFLSLRDKAFLILDHIRLPHPGRFESRFHTFAQTKVKKAGSKSGPKTGPNGEVELRGERQAMRVLLAASRPSSVYTSVDATTTPGKESQVVRWCVDKLHTQVVLAALLVPGKAAASLRLEAEDAQLRVEAAGAGWRVALTLEPDLRTGKPSTGPRPSARPKRPALK